MSKRKKTRIRNPYGTHNRQFIASADRNDMYFLRYWEQMLELSCLRFEWQGIPDTIDERFLELTLNQQGAAIYFRDEVVEYDLSLQVAGYGRWDIYNVPMDRTAYGANGYQYRLSNQNSVMIYNNIMHTPTTLLIQVFATRLAELDRIIDVNVNAMRTPVMVICDENERLTLENLYMQYEGNVPFIFAAKGLNRDEMNVLKTDAPYVAGDLNELKQTIWNEFLTSLGYSNVSQQKKERLVTDEVVRGMGGALAMRNSGLLMRQQAADRINKMFGTTIEVNFREYLPETFLQMNSPAGIIEETGGDTE